MIKTFTVLDNFRNPVATLPYHRFECNGEEIIVLALDISSHQNLTIQFEQEDLSNYYTYPYGSLRDQTFLFFCLALDSLQKAGWDFVRFPNPDIVSLKSKIKLQGFRTYSKN